MPRLTGASRFQSHAALEMCVMVRDARRQGVAQLLFASEMGIPDAYRLRHRAITMSTSEIFASPPRQGSVRSRTTTRYADRLSWTVCPSNGQHVG